MAKCCLELRMMTSADLDRSIARRVDMMTVDPTVALPGSVTEEEGDDAFAVPG